jgi:hypothetical protein
MVPGGFQAKLQVGVWWVWSWHITLSSRQCQLGGATMGMGAQGEQAAELAGYLGDWFAMQQTRQYTGIKHWAPPGDAGLLAGVEYVLSSQSVGLGACNAVWQHGDAKSMLKTEPDKFHAQTHPC